MLALFILIPFGVDAIESAWDKVEEGTETIKFEDAKNFEKSLSDKVAVLNSNLENPETLTTYRYRLTITKHDNLEEDLDKKISRIVTINELFATKSGAISYYDFLEIKAPEYKGKYTITEVEIEKTIEGDSNSIICESVDCVDEIEALNQEREEDQTLETNVSDIKEKLGETQYFRYKDEMDNELNFDTESAAKSFAETAKMTLSSGWKFIQNVIRDFKVKDLLSEVFDTEEEATSALNNFKNSHTNVAVIKNIIPVRNATEDVYGAWARTEIVFDNFEDADSYVDTNDGKENDTTITNVKAISEDVISRTLKVEDYLENPYDTEEAARNAAEELRKTYRDLKYTITPVSIEELSWGEGQIVEGETGSQSSEEFSYSHFDIKVLKTFTYINNGVSETVTGTMTVNSPVVIKNNGYNTYVEMSKNAQNDETGKYLEYASKKRSGLEVTNKSIVEITGTVTFTRNGETITLPYTISGYLSEAQNACGGKGRQRGYDLLFKSVKIINNKVLIDANIITKYEVTGTMNEYKTQYVIYTQDVTKGFDYEVEANGYKQLFAVDAEAKEILVEEGQMLTYRFDTKVKEIAYQLSYEVFSYGLTQYADVEWVIERNVDAKGDGEDYPTPPQTGNGRGTMISLMGLLALALSSLFIKKKEN